MKKDRMLLFVALAVVLACGFCGYQAVAQDLAGEAQARVITIGHITGAAIPLASGGMFQGITGFGINPPVAGDWPCFGGATDCSGIAAGGLVIGTPLQVWSKSCSGCGQIYWTVQTTSATGSANITATISQGSPAKAIFKFSGNVGTVPANVIDVISVGPVSFTGAAGAATISVSTTIGATTVKGGEHIVLH